MTISLETARELKEAGYPQEDHERYWNDGSLNTESSDISCDRPGDYCPSGKRKNNCEECEYLVRHVTYAAPTTDELLERLPRFVISNNYCCNLRLYPDVVGWTVAYTSYNGEHNISQNNVNISEALASMWVYLKSHNLLGKE
jgi:hypothetical protein